MLAKPQGFPRKLGGCAGLDPRLRSAVSAGVGDGERGLRRGLRAPGVGVRPKWVLEYSPSNKKIRYFVSITYVRTGLWTAHKFCGGGKHYLFDPTFNTTFHDRAGGCQLDFFELVDALDAGGLDRIEVRTRSIQGRDWISIGPLMESFFGLKEVIGDRYVYGRSDGRLTDYLENCGSSSFRQIVCRWTRVRG